MKTLTLLIAAGIALSGCAIVPAYGPPGVYGYAPPAVVVQPYYGYGGHGGHGGRGHRGWH